MKSLDQKPGLVTPGPCRARDTKITLGTGKAWLVLVRSLTAFSTIAILTAAVSGAGAAQSLTKGSVVGTVVADEEPVWEARVILIDQRTGVRRSVLTEIDGRFSFGLLPPADYELRVEKIPYGPVRAIIPVLPRRGVSLPPIALELVDLPVHDIGEFPFAAGAADAGRIGNSRYVSGELTQLTADRNLGATDLTRLLVANADLVGGLPGAYRGFVVEGVPVRGASFSGLESQRTTASWLSGDALAGVELVFNPVDVELGGTPSGWFVGYPLRGGRDLKFKAEADFSGDMLAQSRFFNPTSFSSTRATILLNGPMVQDTSHFAIGLQFRQTETPTPQAWRTRALDDRLVSAAADSFGVDLSNYANPGATRTQIVSGFGRIDAQIGDGTLATLTAGMGLVRESDPGLGPAHVRSLGGTYDGLDITVVGTIAAGQIGGLRHEFRAGFSLGRREYGSGTGFAGTNIGNNGVRFGLDELLPGRISRSNFFVSETVYARFGSHNVKVGLGGGVSSYVQTVGTGRRGNFTFGNISQWEAGTGSFWQSVGGSRETTVSGPSGFIYIQDTWIPTSRVQLTFGVRMDVEGVPAGDIPVNQDWLGLTGISNNGTAFVFDSIGNLSTETVGKKTNFSPRIGLSYELGAEREWVVNAAAGVFVGDVDPGMFNDLIGRSGGYEIRRGVGQLGNWPSVPDSTVAPIQGSSLAVLHPEYQAPRTFRASIGIARDLGRRTVVHASFQYRHTDFLPRVGDLNRLPAPIGVDQYDRPVWGQLVQLGPGLTVNPGSNRRFSNFDFVTAFNPDGYSDYVDLTVGLERQVGQAVRLHAQYSFSETSDNWPGGPGVVENRLTPFPDSLNGRDWADGVSDYDIPHRASVALVVSPASLPVTVSALYRFSSGRPFTPGFPYGVDANGDGSGTNDPAFIDPALPGMGPLMSESCLASQSGQFAARNSCRMASRQRLDAMATLHIKRGGSLPIALTVDGLNLLDAREGLVDNALYRVDGAVATVAGVTTVPLTVNPNFGKLLYRTGTGRAVRVGVRIGI